MTIISWNVNGLRQRHAQLGARGGAQHGAVVAGAHHHARAAAREGSEEALDQLELGRHGPSIVAPWPSP